MLADLTLAGEDAVLGQVGPRMGSGQYRCGIWQCTFGSNGGSEKGT